MSFHRPAFKDYFAGGDLFQLSLLLFSAVEVKDICGRRQ